jgi:hypothetical protein
MYIRIVSWHIVRVWTRLPDRAVTLCGRSAQGDGRAEFPSDEKSCESCLRINTKRLQS